MWLQEGTMSKGRIIFLSVFFIVVVALIVVFSTVFNLKSVRVEYISNAPILQENYTEQDIINAGEFPYGKNVLFLDVDEISTRIEQTIPYAKVQKIMRQFPNKMVVYVVERTPAFKVNVPGSVNEWVILDDSFKVLRVALDSELLETERNVPTLSFGEGLTDEQKLVVPADIVAGQTIAQSFVHSFIQTITKSVYATTFTYNFITNIEIKRENTDHIAELVFTVTDNEGIENREIRIAVHQMADFSVLTHNALNLYKLLINQGEDFEYIDSRMVNGEPTCVAFHGDTEITVQP